MNDFAHLSSQAAITHWSWTIAFFLWFAGISGMGMLAYYWVRRRAMAYMVLATAVVGTLLVASHLTRWWNLPAAIFHTLMNFSFNFGSWMLLGILLLCVHCVFGALIAAHHWGVAQRWSQFKWLAVIDQLAVDSRVLIGAGVIGVLVTIYSGFLLTQAIGVPLWNTALIPALWVVSAGAAVLAVIELFALKGWVEHSVAAFGQKLALGVESFKLIMVFAFLHVGMSAASAGARAGASELATGSLAPMMWVGVIGLGVLVPIGVGLLSLKGKASQPLIAAGAVFGLLGGLLLRASVLLAGYFDPLIL